MAGKKVLLIGLDPKVVDYTKWPGLTAEKLKAGSKAGIATLASKGYDASTCFIDHGETAEATVTDALSTTRYECILIGAGVRVDPAEFLLFERLINVILRHAPSARVCFNTGPGDTVEAIERWV